MQLLFDLNFKSVSNLQIRKKYPVFSKGGAQSQLLSYFNLILNFLRKFPSMPQIIKLGFKHTDSIHLSSIISCCGPHLRPLQIPLGRALALLIFL
jgi:hypothetical protein